MVVKILQPRECSDCAKIQWCQKRSAWALGLHSASWKPLGIGDSYHCYLKRVMFLVLAQGCWVIRTQCMVSELEFSSLTSIIWWFNWVLGPFFSTFWVKTEAMNNMLKHAVHFFTIQLPHRYLRTSTHKEGSLVVRAQYEDKQHSFPSYRRTQLPTWIVIPVQHWLHNTIFCHPTVPWKIGTSELFVCCCWLSYFGQVRKNALKKVHKTGFFWLWIIFFSAVAPRIPAKSGFEISGQLPEQQTIDVWIGVLDVLQHYNLNTT